jgi:hypothetical protein
MAWTGDVSTVKISKVRRGGLAHALLFICLEGNLK